jgi:hypothetical protein
VRVVCCQVEISATGLSLARRSPTDCGVSECDREASTMWSSWPTRGVCIVNETFIAHLDLKTFVSTEGGAPEIPSYPVPGGPAGPPCLLGTSTERRVQVYDHFKDKKHTGYFLGAFGKLRKANVSFVMSVRLTA